VSRDATCELGEETKKGQKLSRVKLAICPDHPRRRSLLKFCMRGRVREAFLHVIPVWDDYRPAAGLMHINELKFSQYDGAADYQPCRLAKQPLNSMQLQH